MKEATVSAVARRMNVHWTMIANEPVLVFASKFAFSAPILECFAVAFQDFFYELSNRTGVDLNAEYNAAQNRGPVHRASHELKKAGRFW